MKTLKSIIAIGFISFTFLRMHAMEFEILKDTDQVRVSRWKVEAGEEVGLHRDKQPAIVIVIQGGTITRLEPDGTTTEVHFPQGVAVNRPVDRFAEPHRSINNGASPVEAIMVEFKQSAV